MTAPNDRLGKLPAIGDVDQERGEFWVENPLMIPELGENLSAFERNKLFINVDGQKFIDGSFASSTDIDSDSRSVIGCDIDRDGAQDLLVASAGGGSLRVFSNQLLQNNRIEIRLRGVKSNRPGIGARLTAHCGDKQIVRDLFPTNGFMGIGPAAAWIGLGQAEKIDKLMIRWPAGETQELTDLDANQSIRIRENSREIEVLHKW
ncbi:MAG: ASPIC/UnbV domain-containing protein [Mariniblastus sp.]|nr:ASPIC/UnbV domain-containing protein [Mariniblastus sp.]